ncbi:MFS transporter [Paenibacillus mendelii]|uniref:MFS transporter n=1 Tax=Paenibacillus mendelii TaxID=206163 RepID=A0ABV6J404_9BACL|nr:MFS transporter [Paenibacillus mendelii]MCQ6561867.1 MFS transporter [Paenibacillus mendelii]
MTRLVFLGCFAYLVVGLGQLVIGAVMEPMIHAYGVQYSDGGQLVMHQFLGGMTGMLLTPWLIRKFGKKAVLLTVIGITIAAEAVYVMLPPWTIMLAIAPLAGFGLGTTESVVGSFIIGSTGKNANVAMSRVEVFFGIGALLMPFAGALLIAAGYWRMTFGIVGLLAVGALLLWVFYWPTLLDQPSEDSGSHDDAAPAVTAGGSRRYLPVLMAGIAFFALYVGLEMSFIHYLPSILVGSNGLSESSATLALSLFWGAMVLGRLVAGQMADRFGGAAYLLLVCAVTAVLFSVMGLLTGAAATFILTFGTGLFMSGMFAIALVFTNRAIPGQTERTTSLLMAAGGIGGALVPKATGWFMDDFGPEATRWLFTGCALLLFLVMIAAAAAARSKKPAARPAAA